MISRKRVRDFNKILTCLLCKGYLIEATTINTCMHSCKFQKSPFLKHKNAKSNLNSKKYSLPFLRFKACETL